MARSQLDRGPHAAYPHGTGRPGGGPVAGPDADDTGCTVLHVDMDAFYASVSLLDHPELVGQPVVVGGSGGRGVVLSATYEARALGVHSAMPMGRARRLAPHAVVLPPDHRRYAEVSAGVMEVFRSTTPDVEPLSVDEAFLDVRGSMRRLGTPRQIAGQIRARVLDEQGVTCSVGVATTKFVAKLASSRCKPDGLCVVPADGVVEYLHPLPVGALWGVGEKTAEHLERLGLRTVGDVAHTPRTTLLRALGEATGAHLAALAWGRDPRPVVGRPAEKSIGAEETFSSDVDDEAVVLREVLRLSELTAARLRAGGLVARTVVLKVRFADFATITRSRTLDERTDVSREVYGAARALWEALRLDRARIRLVGVRVEGLSSAASAHHQMRLDDRDRGWREADRATDRATARFGSASVTSASLLRGRRGDPGSSGVRPATRPEV
ncbi:DNA polymerase IV [Pseudokineococcus lusitanus]|uniref:DNA polymerase IV n=1 Tax=Pseudokineococcus lusitanus TaxID=763993 RepID=A0A3N1HKX0_9ACTN|nr:DNA polymerase IV [Pseudokineococcus lusitanus]ROP43101.1 DNA polymerase-4 [Pseudokineococcus lusitanus]